MKKLLALLLLVTLTSCFTTGVPGAQSPAPRDWSKFEAPPIGTPVMLRVFNVPYPGDCEVVDLPGKWDDGEPFLVSFPVYKRLDSVIRVEVHFRGEVIAALNFVPPTIFEKGKTVGWRK